MPYYAWRGVDLSGRWCTGKSFAPEIPKLDEQLFESGIALITSKKIRPLFCPLVKQDDCTRFLQSLATLLNAGVLLPDALKLLRDGFGHVRMQLMIEDMVQAVERGYSLADACGQYPACFNGLTVQLMRVGEEVGALPTTLSVLVAHLDAASALWSRMRSALMMPLMTLLFFGLIAVAIVMVVVPTMASVLQSAGGQLPAITKLLLAFHEWVKSWQALGALVIAALFSFLLYRWLRASERGRILCDRLVLHIPFVRYMVIESNAAWVYQSLATLLRGGTEVVPALVIAAHAIHNQSLKANFLGVYQSVSEGNSLSAALHLQAPRLCTAIDRAIVQVGENSATVPDALQILFVTHQKRAFDLFSWVTVVVQPLLLIIIGLLVALLVMAIYAPLFTFSQVL